MKLPNIFFRYRFLIITIASFIILFLLSDTLFRFARKIIPKYHEKVKFEMDKKKIKKLVLENGLTILTYKNPNTPKVLLQIAYDVGSWVEQSGERGLAHLIEHMIFKGTQKMSEGDIDSIARKYGASFNAFTSMDMTSYYFELNKNNWEPFMDILADCMENARFDPEHLASELRAVIQELKMLEDSFGRKMFEQACLELYPPNHPYHFPVIGFKEDLVKLSAENLKKFYKKYYKPDRATLFIVGDINEEEALKIAKNSFEKIALTDKNYKKTELSEESIFPPLHQQTVKQKTVLYEDVKKEQLGFYWLIPGLKDKSKEIASVTEFILGQGEGSRLYSRLVDKDQIASSAACAAYQFKESGIFFVIVEPLKGKTKECKKAVIEEIEKIIKNGLEKSELTKVINTKTREYFNLMQNLSSFTYEWIESYLSTKNEFDIFEKTARYKKIDSKQVQNFATTFLDPFFINQVQIMPLPENKKDIWLKSKEESEKLDMQILQKHPRSTPLEEAKYIKTLKEPNPLEFKFPKPTASFSLENELVTILYKNSQWPIVTVKCKFKQSKFLSGSKDGIILDLMMNGLIEGTKKHSKADNVLFFENLGASYSFDCSGGSVLLLSKDIADILDRFFEILTEPAFTEETLKKLKEIFIDSYQRRKDSSEQQAIRLLKSAIYKDHPYSWNFDDAINMINNLTVENLNELHKKYVSPKNMVLTISGDFEPKEIEKNIEESFGKWQSDQEQINVNFESKFVPNQKIDKFMLRDQVVLLMGRPSILDVYSPDLIPLKLIDIIVFDSMGSRLYQLREQTGLFYAAFGMFGAGASQIKGFDYFGSILSLNTTEKAEKLILDLITEVGDRGVTESELNAAKQIYFKGLIDLTSSNNSIASMLSRLKSLELGFDYYDKALKRIQTITLEEINKICKKYFTKKDFTRVRVGRVGKKE